MIRILIIFSLLTVFGCHSVVDTLDPEQAALVAVQDLPSCAACGGWIVLIDKVVFRADLPASFSKPNTAVWLRYEEDESSQERKAAKWIKIRSIRERTP